MVTVSQSSIWANVIVGTCCWGLPLPGFTGENGLQRLGYSREGLDESAEGPCLAQFLTWRKTCAIGPD